MTNYVMPKTISDRLKTWSMQKLGLGSTEDKKRFTDKIYQWLQRFPSVFENSQVKVVGTQNIFYSNQTVYPNLRKDDKQPKWTMFRDGALISKRQKRGVQDEDLLLGEIQINEQMSQCGLDLFNVVQRDMIKMVAGNAQGQANRNIKDKDFATLKIKRNYYYEKPLVSVDHLPAHLAASEASMTQHVENTDKMNDWLSKHESGVDFKLRRC